MIDTYRGERGDQLSSVYVHRQKLSDVLLKCVKARYIDCFEFRPPWYCVSTAKFKIEILRKSLITEFVRLSSSEIV